MQLIHAEETSLQNSPLEEIIFYLNSLSGRAKLEALEAILAHSQISYQDISELCKFNDANYTRNRIAGSKFYDLYVMCWKSGQASTIHDHANSSCALKVLDGTATETSFELIDTENRLVRKTKTTEYHSGEQCAAQDSQIHQIKNASIDSALVTLHIYSPPLKMGIYHLSE